MVIFLFTSRIELLFCCLFRSVFVCSFICLFACLFLLCWGSDACLCFLGVEKGGLTTDARFVVLPVNGDMYVCGDCGNFRFSSVSSETSASQRIPKQ